MTQRSYFWGGTTVGDATLAPYDDDEFSDFIASLFTRDRTKQGVVASSRTGFTGNLAVTNPAGTTIRVANGIAMVDGKKYENDANVDFSITAPGAGWNYYRIVLRKDWAAQTVRLVQLGPDTVTYPSVTQTDGTLWELNLADVAINSSSAVSLIDQRTYFYAPATRYMFLPALSGRNVTDSTNIVANWSDTTANPFLSLPDNKVCRVSNAFTIPQNTIIGSTMNVYSIARPNVAVGGNLYGLIYAQWGRVGEAIAGGNFGSLTPSTYTFIGNSILFRTHTASVTITASMLSSICLLRFDRDAVSASDTVGDTIEFYGFNVEFQSNI